MDRYLAVATDHNERLMLIGLVAGAAASLALLALGRGNQWAGAAVILGASAVAQYYGGYWDLPIALDRAAVFAFSIGAFAAAGAARTASFGVGSVTALCGALIATGGVFLGVPENSPSVVAGGMLIALLMFTVVFRLSLGASSRAAIVVLILWTAVVGAVGRPFAVVGGALCLGLAPWLVFVAWIPQHRYQVRAGAWLLLVHLGLVVTAARWIGVVPRAHWARIVGVATVGILVMVGTRWKRCEGGARCEAIEEAG